MWSSTLFSTLVAIAVVSVPIYGQITGDPCDTPGSLTTGPPPGGGSGCALYFCKSDNTYDVTICGRNVPCTTNDAGNPTCAS